MPRKVVASMERLRAAGRVTKMLIMWVGLMVYVKDD
jgi:hypothetical protein